MLFNAGGVISGQRAQFPNEQFPMNDNEIDIIDVDYAAKSNSTDIKSAIAFATSTQDNRLSVDEMNMVAVMRDVKLDRIPSDVIASSRENVSSPHNSDNSSTTNLRETVATSAMQSTGRTKNSHTQLLRNHLSSRAAIKSSSVMTSVAAASANGNTNLTMQKSHKTDAPMLNYIFDSHLATNKHHHYDR